MGLFIQATAGFQDSDILQKAVKMALRCILSVNYHLSGVKILPGPTHDQDRDNRNAVTQVALFCSLTRLLHIQLQTSPRRMITSKERILVFRPDVFEPLFFVFFFSGGGGVTN